MAMYRKQNLQYGGHGGKRPDLTSKEKVLSFEIRKKMPLVVMCGYPCSGKSRRAKELKNHFEVSRGKTVHLAGDESLNLERNAVYSGIIL